MIVIQNKIDLLPVGHPFEKNSIHPHLSIATHDHKKIDELKRFLVNALENNFSNSDIIVSNMRHYTAIQKTLEALSAIKKGLSEQIPSDLLSIDLNVALDALGEITGEMNTEDLLGNIFSKFCIGK